MDLGYGIDLCLRFQECSEAPQLTPTRSDVEWSEFSLRQQQTESLREKDDGKTLEKYRRH